VTVMCGQLVLMSSNRLDRWKSASSCSTQSQPTYTSTTSDVHCTLSNLVTICL